MPALHWSFDVPSSPSLQELPLFVNWQFPPEQLSLVQGLPSSQTLADPLHEPDDEQVSFTVQPSPSLQGPLPAHEESPGHVQLEVQVALCTPQSPQP